MTSPPLQAADSRAEVRVPVGLLAFSVGAIVANIYYAQPLLAEMARTFGVTVSRIGFVAMLSQIGTATGLAILGSIGAAVTLADWHRQAGSLPPAEQQRAARVGADVAVGQVHAAAASAGQHALDLATASFLRGFELALLLAGAILVVAGVVGFVGLRHLRSPTSRPRQRTYVSTSR